MGAEGLRRLVVGGLSVGMFTSLNRGHDWRLGQVLYDRQGGGDYAARN